MNVNCPHCGTEYEVAKKDFGRSTTCEACGNNFVIVEKPGVRINAANKALQSVSIWSSSNIGIWVCIAILVLNLGILVTMCYLMYGGFRKIDMAITNVRKSVDFMSEDIGNGVSSVHNELKQIEKSRHYDAEQIYDRLKQMEDSRHYDVEQIYNRIGRMKLY